MAMDDNGICLISAHCFHYVFTTFSAIKCDMWYDLMRICIKIYAESSGRRQTWLFFLQFIVFCFNLLLLCYLNGAVMKCTWLISNIYIHIVCIYLVVSTLFPPPYAFISVIIYLYVRGNGHFFLIGTNAPISVRVFMVIFDKSKFLHWIIILFVLKAAFILCYLNVGYI